MPDETYEPKEERIKAAIVERLEQLRPDDGVTCWYKATRVYRCGRKWDPTILAPGLGKPEAPAVVYAVRSLPPRMRELGSSGQCEGELEVFILCARQDFRAPGGPENEAAPREDLVAARLQRDAVRALLRDEDGIEPTLGALVTNVMDEEGVQGEDFERKGWVIRVLRMVMPYPFMSDAP